MISRKTFSGNRERDLCSLRQISFFLFRSNLDKNYFNFAWLSTSLFFWNSSITLRLTTELAFDAFPWLFKIFELETFTIFIVSHFLLLRTNLFSTFLHNRSLCSRTLIYVLTRRLLEENWDRNFQFLVAENFAFLSVFVERLCRPSYSIFSSYIFAPKLSVTKLHSTRKSNFSLQHFALFANIVLDFFHLTTFAVPLTASSQTQNLWHASKFMLCCTLRLNRDHQSRLNRSKKLICVASRWQTGNGSFNGYKRSDMRLIAWAMFFRASWSIFKTAEL